MSKRVALECITCNAVAQAVAMLAAADCDYVTGSSLTVDGGQTASSA